MARASSKRCNVCRRGAGCRGRPAGTSLCWPRVKTIGLAAGLRGFCADRSIITNVVKCRPPGNRLPTPVEAAACQPCLLEQIGPDPAKYNNRLLRRAYRTGSGGPGGKDYAGAGVVVRKERRESPADVSPCDGAEGSGVCGSATVPPTWRDLP